MFDGQELNEQNSEYFEQPPLDIDELKEEQPTDKNPNGSYLANIRKSQGVKKGTFIILDEVEDETFLVEKPVRRATVAETDTNVPIKPFTRGGANPDRCKSPNLIPS
jgi:hypothetical protein